MSEALDKLHSIGAQKICEQTHIPIGHVQAILHESYDGLNKIQFIGFISILEREYSCDLSSVKRKGITYFDGETKDEEEQSIFVQTKKTRNNKVLYIILGVILFLVYLFTFYGDTKEVATAAPVQEHEIIQQVKEKVQDNTTADTNLSLQVEENTTVETQPQPIEAEPIAKSFTIKTNKKLWLGYIELDTNKKRQTTIKEELSLDPNINWLITLGHGYVTMEVNGEEETFKTAKGLKFLYKDGELKPITLEEFKRYNRGYVW